MLYSCLLSSKTASAPTSSEMLVGKPEKKEHLEKVKNLTGRGVEKNRTGQEHIYWEVERRMETKGAVALYSH